jgi:tetratricopeptide (TPR) repeat protein
MRHASSSDSFREYQSSGAAMQISAEEREQIQQTIEMFEVITQANPNDVQSLEVLKDAYWKLDRHSDAIDVTRRLADTHVALGQYSSAVLEYEGILQKDPDNPEIVAILGEVEARLAETGAREHRRSSGTFNGEDFSIDFDLGPPDQFDAGLITTSATQQQGTSGKRKVDLENDGNDSLAKFLVQHRIVPERIVQSSLEHTRKINANCETNAIAASLINEIVSTKMVDLEEVLNGILDRTKFAYVPLEYYDIDRQIVKMLPDSLTIGRLIVPFDLMSRTVMIAMANPFDAVGKEAVQQLFDYNIQWHLASPDAIAKVLTSAYKIEAR